MLLIFRYSAQILLDNALFCRQNARPKNRLFCSKFCRQNLSKLSRVTRCKARKIYTRCQAQENARWSIHDSFVWSRCFKYCFMFISFLAVDYLAQVFDVLKTDLKDDVVSFLPWYFVSLSHLSTKQCDEKLCPAFTSTRDVWLLYWLLWHF